MGNIEDCNLFMMCQNLNQNTLTEIPKGYSARPCRKDEFEIWLEFPFDFEADKKNYQNFMTDYFRDVYAPREELFWKNCLFICDETDTPIGTCFAWKAYGCVTTIHWFKVKKEHEGQGIGRALLSFIMSNLSPDDFPVFLHTQPGSFKAIKLYTDMGFSLLTDPQIGFRKNELEIALPYLKEKMYPADYQKLRFAKAPDTFLRDVKTSELAEF